MSYNLRKSKTMSSLDKHIINPKTMISQIAIYWDLDTCPADRIESVVNSVRRLCILDNNLEEKHFVCYSFAEQNKDIERQLKIEFKKLNKSAEVVKHLLVTIDINLDVLDANTSLVLITSDRLLIDWVHKMTNCVQIVVIYGSDADIRSNEWPKNIKLLPFDKFKDFCVDYQLVSKILSNLRASDNSSDNETEDNDIDVNLWFETQTLPLEEQKSESNDGLKLKEVVENAKQFVTDLSNRFDNLIITAKSLAEIDIQSDPQLTQQDSQKIEESEQQTEEEGRMEIEEGEEQVEQVEQDLSNTEEEPIISGVCGLQNLGNTCYMNSGLQCLSNVKPLTEFVFEFIKTEIGSKNEIKNTLFAIFCDLIANMWSAKTTTIEPNLFKAKISELWERFDGNTQNDCSELLTEILNQFNEDLLEIQTNESQVFTSIDESCDSFYTFIAQTFYGSQRFLLICDCGQTLADEKQLFPVLHLPTKDKITAFVFLILKNRNVFQIELSLAENPISVKQLLTETVKIFEESCSPTLDLNNLIPVLIDNNNMIENIYDFRSVVDFNEGLVYIYERDPLFPIITFLILISSEAFGFPLLLNVNNWDKHSLSEEFLSQMLYYCSDLTENQMTELLSVDFDEYKQMIVNHSLTDASEETYLTINVLITNPIGRQIDDKYNANPIFLKSQESEGYKLEDSLKECFSLRILDTPMACNQCKGCEFPLQKTSILYSPKVLILQLKSDPKIQSKCYFPLILDFNEYLSEEKEKRDNTYDLIAISNYKESHYTTYANNYLNKKWYEFDDNYVREINESQLISSNAYLLFYLKR